jgi:site-specific DNA recombinase
VLRGEDGLAVKVWEPILSDAVSEELRRALAPKSTRERPGRYAERLLTGLVVCERCSGRMRVRHVRRTRRKGEPEATRPPVAVYECVAYQSGRKCGTGTAGGPTVRADWLEDFVGEDLLRRFGRFGVFEKRVRPGADAERLARVQEAIAATAAALATKADAETFSRLGMLQAERDELAAAPAAPIVEYVPLDPPRAVVDYWPTAGLAERREMLAAYLEVVEVAPTGRRGGPWRFRLDPQRVEVRWSEDALDGESAGPGAIAS